MLARWLQVAPALNHTAERYMLETVDMALCLTSAHAAADLQVQAWTNLPTRFHSEGGWYAVDIPHHHTNGEQLHFQTSLQPTSPGQFGLTYRVRHRHHPDRLQWMGGPGDNVHLAIQPPHPAMDWTQRPHLAEVMPGVFVGNFIAATQAASLQLDAVLNMAAELNPSFADGAIAYCKLGCLDGAQHPIPESHLQAAVAWIDSQRRQGRQVLIHCRAGIGRSGSIGIAYCFYGHPHWSYAQTLEHIWRQKPNIYPHRQLQASLERLFPRQPG